MSTLPAGNARRRIPARPSSSTSSPATRPPRASASTFGSRRSARRPCRSRRAGSRARARRRRGGRRARLRSLQRRRLRRAGERHVRRDGGSAAHGGAQRRGARARHRARRSPSRTGVATPIATGGMLPRGADAVLMVEHSELVESATGAADGDPAPAHRRRERELRRHRHRARRDRASRRAAPHLARDRRARRARARRDRRLSAAARGDLLDGQRDRGAGRAAASRRGLRLQRRDHRRGRGGSWAASPCTWASFPTTKHALDRGARARSRSRSRRVLGRHVEGRGRPLVSRREPARESRASSRTAWR